MSKSMPRCAKCRQRHYNFTPCVEAADHREVDAEKKRRQENAAAPQLRPRANDWGDRTVDYVRIGDNTVGIRRPPLHSVTNPRKEAA